MHSTVRRIAAALAKEQRHKLGENDLSALRTLAHERVWHLAFVSFTIQIGTSAIYFWIASSGEIAFHCLLEHRGWHPGDDSSSRRFTGDDPRVPQLRSDEIT
jgi:hypothetical protein